MIVIVAGVSGSGKTTIAKAVAVRLGWRFCDADALHEVDAVERMRRGEALDDSIRQPWLQRVRATIDRSVAAGESLVVACSALKESYRQHLMGGVRPVRFVLLAADRPLLLERLSNRRGHFAGPALLDSQLATLELPAYGLRLDAGQPVEVLVEAVISYATGAEPDGGGTMH